MYVNERNCQYSWQSSIQRVLQSIHLKSHNWWSPVNNLQHRWWFTGTFTNNTDRWWFTATFCKSHGMGTITGWWWDHRIVPAKYFIGAYKYFKIHCTLWFQSVLVRYNFMKLLDKTLPWEGSKEVAQWYWIPLKFSISGYTLITSLAYVSLSLINGMSSFIIIMLSHTSCDWPP